MQDDIQSIPSRIVPSRRNLELTMLRGATSSSPVSVTQDSHCKKILRVLLRASQATTLSHRYLQQTRLDIQYKQLAEGRSHKLSGLSCSYLESPFLSGPFLGRKLLVFHRTVRDNRHRAWKGATAIGRDPERGRASPSERGQSLQCPGKGLPMRFLAALVTINTLEPFCVCWRFVTCG